MDVLLGIGVAVSVKLGVAVIVCVGVEVAFGVPHEAGTYRKVSMPM